VEDREEHEADRLMLDWAARVAEIGLSVAHAQYHKHSAYILSNADMPGFSRMEQQRLARIVLAHRGKLGKMQDAGLEGTDWTLVFALRVAALVLRNRTDARFPMLRVAGDKSGYRIDLPESWLEENPLAAAALETERRHWESVDLRFEIGSLSERKVAQLRG
jgi:exopolyphosphatase/guanosine-5'-triphosphate,3'-diphosphate pyrophosphatase